MYTIKSRNANFYVIMFNDVSNSFANSDVDQRSIGGNQQECAFVDFLVRKFPTPSDP